MSEFKGTPGPWFIENGDDIVRHTIQDFNYNYSLPVKFASGWVEGAWFGSDATEESKSNARLIAAAPDLLDDGQCLLDRLVEFERELEDDAVAREFYGHVSPAIARFRAAIAKALGETK